MEPVSNRIKMAIIYEYLLCATHYTKNISYLSPHNHPYQVTTFISFTTWEN